MLELRPEAAADHAGIDRLLELCFPGSGEAALVRALRTDGRLPLSLVAADGAEIVGQVAFSPVNVVPGGALGLGLAPLCVAPSRQGQGIGSALVAAGLDAARAAGARWCVVLGDPGYYTRFGFRPATEFGLGNEYGAGPEFMALALVPDGLAALSGIVAFAPEFAQVAPPV